MAASANETASSKMQFPGLEVFNLKGKASTCTWKQRTRWCFHVFRQIPPQGQSMDVANALAIYNWHCIKQRRIRRICAQATMTLAPLSAANLVQTFVPFTFLAKTLGINLQIWSSEMWHSTICSRSSSPKRWAESCQSVPIWFTGEKAKMVCKYVRNTLVLPACSINPSHGIMLHWSTCRHDSHFGQKFCGIKEWRKKNIAVCTSPLTLRSILPAPFCAPHPLKDANIPSTNGKPSKSQQNQGDLLTKTV